MPFESEKLQSFILEVYKIAGISSRSFETGWRASYKQVTFL